jgi:predicted transcriptional regulator
MDKKTFSFRVDETILKPLKYLAVDLDRSIGSLVEEAVRDLLKKYAKAPPKKSKA